MADLKKVYQSVTEEEALSNLMAFKEAWGKQYPSCVKSWEENWDILSTFYAYPPEIRKIIYTTNIIKGLNWQFRKIGNRISVAVVKNAADGTRFDVITYLSGSEKDRQTVPGNGEGLSNNDWVDFTVTDSLTAEAGVTLEGGTNEDIGRSILRADIISCMKELQDMRVIQNFDSVTDVTVLQGMDILISRRSLSIT